MRAEIRLVCCLLLAACIINYSIRLNRQRSILHTVRISQHWRRVGSAAAAAVAIAAAAAAV